MKLRRSLQRPAVYVLSLALASLFVSPGVLRAAETAPLHLAITDVNGGKTITLANGAKAGIFPGSVTTEADVTWTVSEASLPTLPSDHALLGSVYRLTINGPSGFTVGVQRPAAIAVPKGTSNWIRQIWRYDAAASAWVPLPTKFQSTGTLATAPVTSLDGLYAVLEDHNHQEGIASWYCKRACSKRYPTLHATSNDFPVGSFVKVKSLETGKSVTVKIISRWGQPAGRVVDLSWPAYAALKTKNKGLTRVHVQPVSAQTASVNPSTVIGAVEAETLPSFHAVRVASSPTPTVSATSFAVVNASSLTKLDGKNDAASVPIASLTKLMTAMVFLDTKPDMKKIIAYAKEDITSYAYLRINPGETLSVADLYYSTMVGSANNAATALARSTGMTRAAFVAAMNAKAASLGLKGTKYVEVTGLDARNVSTAAEMAIIAAHAFHDYPLIRQATTMPKYTFTTRNTKIYHQILATDKILTANTLTPSLTITGAKTGFIDEAMYTYVLRTKNSQGAQVIAVVLGAPTAAARYQSAIALTNWAFSAWQWTS